MSGAPPAGPPPATVGGAGAVSPPPRVAPLPNEGVVWHKAPSDKRYRKKMVGYDEKKKIMSLKPISVTSRFASGSLKFDPSIAVCQVIPAQEAVEKAAGSGGTGEGADGNLGMVIEENYFRVMVPTSKGHMEINLRGRTEEDRNRWVNYFTSVRVKPQTHDETYPHGRPAPTPSHLPALKRHNSLFHADPSPTADEEGNEVGSPKSGPGSPVAAADGPPLVDLIPLVQEGETPAKSADVNTPRAAGVTETPFTPDSPRTAEELPRTRKRTLSYSGGQKRMNYVQRMVAFYKYYGVTDKATEVYCRPLLENQYKGKEDAVFRALVMKYGPEPGTMAFKKQQQRAQEDEEDDALYTEQDEPHRVYNPKSLRRGPSSDIMRVPKIVVYRCGDGDRANPRPNSEEDIDTSPLTFLSKAQELAVVQQRADVKDVNKLQKRMTAPFVSEFAAAVLNLPPTSGAQTLAVASQTSVNTLGLDAARALEGRGGVAGLGLPCVATRYDEEGQVAEQFQALLSMTDSSFMIDHMPSPTGEVLMGATPTHINYRHVVEFYTYSEGAPPTTPNQSRGSSTGTAGGGSPGRNTTQFQLGVDGQAAGDAETSDDETDTEEGEHKINEEEPELNQVSFTTHQALSFIMKGNSKGDSTRPQHKMVASFRVGPHGQSPSRSGSVEDSVFGVSSAADLDRVLCPPVLSDLTVDDSKIQVIVIDFATAIQRTVCGQLGRKRLPRRIDRPLFTSHIAIHRELLLQAKKRWIDGDRTGRHVEMACMDFRMHSRSRGAF